MTGLLLGTEIEMEAHSNLIAGKLRRSFDVTNELTAWRRVDDNSLRGVGAEYVSVPLNAKDAIIQIKNLDKAFNNVTQTRKGTTGWAPFITPQTGLHIHFSMPNMHELATFPLGVATLAVIARWLEYKIVTMGISRENNYSLFDDVTKQSLMMLDILNTQIVRPDNTPERACEQAMSSTAKYRAINLRNLLPGGIGTIEVRGLNSELSIAEYSAFVGVVSTLYNNMRRLVASAVGNPDIPENWEWSTIAQWFMFSTKPGTFSATMQNDLELTRLLPAVEETKAICETFNILRTEKKQKRKFTPRHRAYALPEHAHGTVVMDEAETRAAPIPPLVVMDAVAHQRRAEQLGAQQRQAAVERAGQARPRTQVQIQAQRLQDAMEAATQTNEEVDG